MTNWEKMSIFWLYHGAFTMPRLYARFMMILQVFMFLNMALFGSMMILDSLCFDHVSHCAPAFEPGSAPAIAPAIAPMIDPASDPEIDLDDIFPYMLDSAEMPPFMKQPMWHELKAWTPETKPPFGAWFVSICDLEQIHMQDFTWWKYCSPEADPQDWIDFKNSMKAMVDSSLLSPGMKGYLYSYVDTWQPMTKPETWDFVAQIFELQSLNGIEIELSDHSSDTDSEIELSDTDSETGLNDLNLSDDSSASDMEISDDDDSWVISDDDDDSWVIV